MKEELGGVLRTMGLTLSEEKTKVTHITEGFNFLDVHFVSPVPVITCKIKSMLASCCNVPLHDKDMDHARSSCAPGVPEPG